MATYILLHTGQCIQKVRAKNVKIERPLFLFLHSLLPVLKYLPSDEMNYCTEQDLRPRPRGPSHVTYTAYYSWTRTLSVEKQQNNTQFPERTRVVESELNAYMPSHGAL